MVRLGLGFDVRRNYAYFIVTIIVILLASLYQFLPTLLLLMECKTSRAIAQQSNCQHKRTMSEMDGLGCRQCVKHILFSDESTSDVSIPHTWELQCGESPKRLNTWTVAAQIQE